MITDNTLNKILNKYEISSSNLIGKGSESHVYRYKDNLVFKVYLKTDITQLIKLRQLYQQLNSQSFSFEFPLIDDIISEEGAVITTEKLLPGISPINLIKQDEEYVRKVLTSMVNVLSGFNQIDFSDKLYGDVLSSNVTYVSWSRFLLEKTKQRILLSETQLNADVANFGWVFQEWSNAILHLPDPARNFVHGDYYFSNVLVDTHGNVTSVLDVSSMSMCGDHILDIVGFLSYLELSDDVKDSSIAEIKAKVYARYSEELRVKYRLYRMYLAIYLSDSYLFDEKLYHWCLRGIHEYADSLH